MGEGATTTDRTDRGRDPHACPQCGEAMLPRLTDAGAAARDGAPLCAEPPVQLACPTCT